MAVHAGARTDWHVLTTLQLGRFAEYLFTMEFTRWGFDVYGTEVDDKGIDFVVRVARDRFYDVQVKSVRPKSGSYIFMRASTFEPRPTNLVALALLRTGDEPEMFLIPATAWAKPNDLLVFREYGEGLKSSPEYGINITMKARPILEQCRFEQQVLSLRSQGPAAT